MQKGLPKSAKIILKSASSAVSAAARAILRIPESSDQRSSSVKIINDPNTAFTPSTEKSPRLFYRFWNHWTKRLLVRLPRKNYPSLLSLKKISAQSGNNLEKTLDL